MEEDMCEFGTALMMGAAGAQAMLGASQQSHQASAQQGAALYQAALARNAALASEYQAQDAERRAAAEEERQRRKTSLLTGAQQARFAAQGTDLLGSPVDILGDIGASGELDALSLRYQGEREAWLQRLQAANHNAKAVEYERAASVINPSFGIADSLLGGASRIVGLGKSAGFFR
ncbi:MAG: hypothetical protein EPO67_24640 [Reyranella sp.]|nr:MAG: hypothetical protein EPO67_24640 [Reyranella sp.]